MIGTVSGQTPTQPSRRPIETFQKIRWPEDQVAVRRSLGTMPSLKNRVSTAQTISAMSMSIERVLPR